MSRPLPAPTELSGGFWSAAADHRLALPRCGACAARFFPPERLCPSCGSVDWTYAATAGSGHVASYTVVHRAPSPEFETPYVLAVVELDEGCSLLTNLVETDPASVSIGMPVRVVFLDLDGRALPVFAAAGDQGPYVADKE